MNMNNKKLYSSNCFCNTNMYMNNSFCNVPDFMPDDPILANAYVPYQILSDVYTPADGLQAGTIFPELERPYTSGQGYMQLMELYMEGGI